MRLAAISIIQQSGTEIVLLIFAQSFASINSLDNSGPEAVIAAIIILLQTKAEASEFFQFYTNTN